jgi:hypothetical protein
MVANSLSAKILIFVYIVGFIFLLGLNGFLIYREVDREMTGFYNNPQKLEAVNQLSEIHNILSQTQVLSGSISWKKLENYNELSPDDIDRYLSVYSEMRGNVAKSQSILNNVMDSPLDPNIGLLYQKLLDDQDSMLESCIEYLTLYKSSGTVSEQDYLKVQDQIDKYAQTRSLLRRVRGESY